MPGKNWFDAGSVKKLKTKTLQQVIVGKTRIALVFKNGEFSAVSGTCNHENGPFVGHSRGWASEDMDNNIAYVRSNKELK